MNNPESTLEIDAFSSITHLRGHAGRFKRKRPILRSEVTLTIAEAFNGCLKKFSFLSKHPCTACESNPENYQDDTTMCSKCAQLIRIRRSNTFLRCEDCKRKERNCPHCNGKKYISSVIKRQVPIPRGVLNGQVLIIPTKNQISHVAPMNIQITCKIKKTVSDGGFELRDSNLFYTKKISVLDLATGRPFSIKHLDGRTLEFPASEEILQPENLFEVKKEGWPRHGNESPGSLYVDFEVIWPDQICSNNEELNELMEMFGIVEDMEFENSPRLNCEMEEVYLEEVEAWSDNHEIAMMFLNGEGVFASRSSCREDRSRSRSRSV